MERFGKDPLLLYWQSFAHPHGKVLRDLTRHNHVGQAIRHVSLVRRRQTTASFNPLANFGLSKLVFALPPQLRLESGLAPTCRGAQPRAASPRGPLGTGSCVRTERSCFGGSATPQGPAPLQRYSAYTKGNSLVSLGTFVGLFHRVHFQFTSLVSAKNGCTQCRKGGFCSIQTGSNGWTGKATL